MPRKKLQPDLGPLAPDVDLDVEIVRDSRGNRIAEAEAEAIAEEVLARAGRPKLVGTTGRNSPHVSFRVPEAVREAAEARAAAEGKTVSQIAREALEQYVG